MGQAEREEKKRKREEKKQQDREKWAAQDAKTVEFLSKPIFGIIWHIVFMGLVSWAAIWMLNSLTVDINDFESGKIKTLRLPAILKPIYDVGGKIGIQVSIIAVVGVILFFQINQLRKKFSKKSD